MSTDIGVEQILLPTEAFSISKIMISEVQLYGITGIRFIDQGDKSAWLDITTHFAHPADLPDGEVEFTIPSRDSHGTTFHMFLTIPDVQDWTLFVEPGSYKNLWRFTYRGVIHNPYGKLEIMKNTGTDESRYVISTKTQLWDGQVSHEPVRDSSKH